MAKVLRSLGLRGMTLHNALRSLGNLRAIGGDGAWQLTEITKRNRSILEAFGIDPPKSKDL